MAMISRRLLLVLLISLFASFGFAEIRLTKIRSDKRPIIYFDDFGFTQSGQLELNVSDIRLDNTSPELDLAKFGFILSTHEPWKHVLEQIEYGKVMCPLNSTSIYVKVICTFKSMKNSALDCLYQETDANQYTLIFVNCLNQVKVSMNVRSAMYNLDGKNNNTSYLSIGKTILPRAYFFFSLVYLTLVGTWIYVLYKRRLTVSRIHFFMLAVVILKVFTLVCEAEDLSYVKLTGSAHGWDVSFYIFNFLKEIAVFTLIILIGAGWSFLKPHLLNKKTMILMTIIPLQVVANLALVYVDESSGRLDHSWMTWNLMFLVANCVCCVLVFLPIFWSTDYFRGEAKLTWFGFTVGIVYLYFGRLIVYCFKMFDYYKYYWISVVAEELVDFAFCVFTGYMFMPEARNPYFVLIDDEVKEEEAAAEQFEA